MGILKHDEDENKNNNDHNDDKQTERTQRAWWRVLQSYWFLMRSGFSYLYLRADYIPSFVAIFHEYISLCGVSIFLKQIISKQIKPIDNLLILSFSLLNQFGFQEKKWFWIEFW